LTNQTGQPADTIRALDKITFNGYVLDDQDSVLKNFNGEVICTIYDKAKSITIVEGSLGSVYKIRNSIIYSGKGTVVNGRFFISFVTPLDINYLVGKAKVSLYAADVINLTDAVGSEMSLYIGGSNEDAPNDITPPTVKTYMNDTTFVNGGLVGTDATFLAHVMDDNGINLATSGIGHEMILSIDNDPSKVYKVNNYFQADPNTYKSGWLQFPLSNLAVGKHKAEIVVWDTYNNSSKSTVNFNVGAPEALVKIENFSAYPNPVNPGGSINFRYNHNLAGENVRTEIALYDAVGRLINTIDWTTEQASSYLGDNGELSWDLKTQSGQMLAGGTYIAKLKSTNTSGNTASGVLKFVVLP